MYLTKDSVVANVSSKSKTVIPLDLFLADLENAIDLFNILVSFNVVIQQGNFTVAGATIIFDFSPTSNDTCNFIMHYGTGVLNTPADDTVKTATIQDNAITSAKIAADQITGAKIPDDAIAQEHIADASVDEARLQISNTPTNGYMLTAQSGNTGGLTWAAQPSGFDVSSITGATALTTQPAGTDEIVLSDAGTLKRLDIKHIQNTPAFMGTKTGGHQIVSDNTWTKVIVNNEVLDSDGTFDHSTNYRFTPGVAGYYFIYGMAEADQNLTSYKWEAGQIQIYKNGSSNGIESRIDLRQGGGDSGTVNISYVIYLDADDYVELYAKARALNDEQCRFADSGTYFGGFRLTGV